MSNPASDRNELDSLWGELLFQACASDGPIRDADVRDAIRMYRPRIEAAALAAERASGAALDVERLAEALAFLGEDDILADGSLWKIKEIALNAAAEYARLAPQEPTPDPRGRSDEHKGGDL